MNVDLNFKAIIIIFVSCFFLGCSSDDNSEINGGNENGGNETGGNNGSTEYRIDLGVGASAKDLLTEATFSKISIEVAYMEGFALTNQAQQQLINFLEKHLNKSSGVEIIQTEIPSQSKGNYSAQDLRVIENENRKSFPMGNEITVWLSIVDGKFENESVIGVAYHNLSTSLMGGTIAGNTGGFGQASRSSIEAAVLKHELGHLLGLVNITTPMVNDHEANGKHCDNSDCLMYFAVETTDLFSLLVTSSVPELDENCKLDLQANGGK